MPVKNYAYVTFKEAVKANVEIYSLAGSLVKTVQVDGSSQIDLSSLTKGYYTLKVISGNNNYAVKFTKE